MMIDVGRQRRRMHSADQSRCKSHLVRGFEIAQRVFDKQCPFGREATGLQQPLIAFALGFRSELRVFDIENAFEHIVELKAFQRPLGMAAAAIMSVPVLLLFAFAQRYFISGVGISGLKL